MSGVRVLVLGRRLQDPGFGATGVLSLACPTSALPSLPPAAGFLSLGGAQILFWGTWQCASRAIQRPGREDSAGPRRGPVPGRWEPRGESGRVQTQGAKIREPEGILKDPLPASPRQFPSHASPVPVSPTTWPLEIAESGRNRRIFETNPNSPRLPRVGK